MSFVCASHKRKENIKNTDIMKKIVLAMAAFAISLGMMSAQDLKTATETYNSGAEALTLGDKTSALEKFKQALTIAETLGEEGSEVASNCKNVIPTVILSIGKEYFNNKDFDNAIAKMKEAASAAAEYGNTDVADEVASLLPQVSLTKSMEKANAAFKAKDVAGAIAGYNEVLAQDTANGVAALRLGQLLSGTGKFSDAIPYLETAARNGQSGNATSLLASTYLKDALGKLKEKKYSEAIELAAKSNEYKENPQTYYVAGQASQKLGLNEAAISYFEKYLEAAPTAKNASAIQFTVAALYHQAGNKTKAVEYYNKVTSDPQFGAQAKQMIASLSK